MKGYIFKGNRIKTLQLRVDLLVCLLKSKQTKFSYTVDFSKLSKKAILCIHPNTDYYKVNVLFKNIFRKINKHFVYIRTRIITKFNLQKYLEPHMSNFRAIEKWSKNK